MKSTCIYILILCVLVECQDRVARYDIGFRYKPSDYLLLARDRNYIIVTIIMLLSHEYIWIIIGDRAGLGLDGLDLVVQ
jgi:hypothetical protein